ncbi:hypothetical protein [Streptomyces tendae]|uniref:hypothetical protein n=1 Tax=Streptomyces tendae TaxID=1932 RepID=UPI0033AD18FC
MHSSKARDIFHARRVLLGALVAVATSVVVTAGISGGGTTAEAPVSAGAPASADGAVPDPIWD